jgi:hypothetical protein
MITARKEAATFASFGDTKENGADAGPFSVAMRMILPVASRIEATKGSCDAMMTMVMTTIDRPLLYSLVVNTRPCGWIENRME